MAQTASKQSGKDLARARRRALASAGKAALAGSAATGAATASQAPVRARAATAPAQPQAAGRAASRARREQMSRSGKAGIQSKDRTRGDSQPAAPTAAPAPQASAEADKAPGRSCSCGCKGKNAPAPESGANATPSAPPRVNAPVANGRRPKLSMSAGRAASLARREATSSRGKAGVGKGGLSAAQSARAANPTLTGRELAMALRDQRSRQGNGARKKSKPCGRVRPKPDAETGAAQDAPWKVGAGETVHGQTVTGTMVGRSQRVTGDEPSTCRAVTGTEYLGADIFREFCQTDPGGTPRKVAVSPTARGNAVTGNKIGRGSNVTGNEPGTCKRVTGAEYAGAGESETYCGTRAEGGASKVTAAATTKGKSVTGSNVGRSAKVTGDESGAARTLSGTQYMEPGDAAAPAKVGVSQTLRGGSLTGTLVGRSERVTGDEPGSCRDVTGDDYVGQEQYSGFCQKAPQPADSKVGVSATLKGKAVTGTMTGRGERVTGDEPGTCKTVTGTPYAGAEQYEGFCRPEETTLAAARTRRTSGTPGAAMTGLQPGINGNLTGAAKGACEPVSGTPYVGADQYAEACPATAAEPSSPDFPQPVGGTPWGQFSVGARVGDATPEAAAGAVTGSQYEQGHITGPFGMAAGKVTGTEEARFGHRNDQTAGAAPLPETAAMVDGRVKSRITGEGMDTGLKITGDDWDRGNNVTGTEGASATRRNPTMRSRGAAATAPEPKRNVEMTAPVSKVTGGSGNTEKGALITYSGGARG